MNSIIYDATFNNFQLDAEKIDIWEFPLAPFFEPARLLLNEEEKRRADRFHFPIHRHRFTMGRATMRLILSYYLNRAPNLLNFLYNRYGKPYLDEHLTITFNLSHSQDLALLAVGKKFSLGIDLEFFSARSYLGIADQLFSQQEFIAFNEVPSLAQQLSFFHIWAQKEAFIKASGMGLAFPTKKFNVPILPISPQLIFDMIHEKNWQLFSFMPQIACCAALCCEPEVKIIRHIKINNPNILFMNE